MWCAGKRTGRHQTLNEYWIGSPSTVSGKFPTTKMNANKLEIFSEEIKREMVKQGECRNNYWEGKRFFQKSLKRKCDEVGLCTVLQQEESRKREEESFPSRTKTECEQGMAEDRDRKSVGISLTLMGEIYTASGLAKIRRIPRVNGGKGRQETVCGRRECGRKLMAWSKQAA